MSLDLPRTAAVASRLVVVEATGSTNADLRASAADQRAWPHLSVLVTEDGRVLVGAVPADTLRAAA